MPEFEKKFVKTEKWVYLTMGTSGMTLEQLAKHMDVLIKGFIRDHGPDAKFELLYRNGQYGMYITKPEHWETDSEYNERIVREIKQGK